MHWFMLLVGMALWLICGLSEPQNPGAWGAGLLFLVPAVPFFAWR